MAVHLLDLDHFKNVNDTLGHPAGDKLLKMVADRLRALVRETDTIARMGGDEFAILQVAIAQPADATALAQRIIEAVSEPYDIDGHQVVIGTSVGIAVGPDDGVDPDQLIRNADLALYRAKGDGRGTYRFFEPEMDAQMQARRAMEYDLRKALAAGEFELHYQPVVNLESNEISGFEALIRWHHPEKGLISPGEFIPLAEEIGFIVPLGEWAIRQACATAAQVARTTSGSPSTSRRCSSAARAWCRSVVERAGGLRPGAGAARARDHRDRAAAGQRGDARPRSTSCARSACASPWTTSAPAIPRSATCRASRSTRSRSTARS